MKVAGKYFNIGHQFPNGKDGSASASPEAPLVPHCAGDRGYCEALFKMWVKQCHKPFGNGLYTPPIYGDLGDGDGLFLFDPHYTKSI